MKIFKIILLLVICSNIQNKKDTRALLILGRHGIRESFLSIIDSELESELTPNGERMLYLNGKYIRKNYDHFISKKFNNNKTKILSSSEPRNLVSSNSFFLGLHDLGTYNEELKVSEKYYTPEWKNVKINNNFKTTLPKGFQPAPVISEFDSGLTFRTYFDQVCPKVNQCKLENKEMEKEIVILSNSILDLIPEELDINYILKKNKFENYTDITDFYDYVLSEYFIKGLDLSKKFLNKIEILGTLGIIGKYYHDRSFMKYHLTRINRLILELFNNAIKKTDPVNFIYLNGHDINILSYFYLLEKTSFECLIKKFKEEDFSTICFDNPKFGSMLIFELYKNNDDFFVDVIYNGMKIDVFNSGACDFSNFTDILNSISRQGTFEDLDKAFCLDDSLKTSHHITLFFMIINLGLSMVVVFFIWKKIKK